MSRIELDLPASIHQAVQDAAKRDGISARQLIVNAITEKLAGLRPTAYLAERASRGSKNHFARVLAKVPARKPLKGDVITPRLRRALRARITRDVDSA